MLDNLKMVATTSALIMSMFNMSEGTPPAPAAAAQPQYPYAANQVNVAPSSGCGYSLMQVIDMINREPYSPQAVDANSTEDMGSALTDEERDLIERIVMASCGNLQNPEMAMANAQVIKDRADSGLFGDSLMAVLTAPNQFENPWKGEVNDVVKEAVTDIFDKGERVTDQPIYYYVNPNTCSISRNRWSQGKAYVTTIGTGKWVHEYWTKS